MGYASGKAANALQFLCLLELFTHPGFFLLDSLTLGNIQPRADDLYGVAARIPQEPHFGADPAIGAFSVTKTQLLRAPASFQQIGNRLRPDAFEIIRVNVQLPERRS